MATLMLKWISDEEKKMKSTRCFYGLHYHGTNGYGCQGNRLYAADDSKKLGFDPAVMASPFITTMVDAISLMVYFGMANLLLFRT